MGCLRHCLLAGLLLPAFVKPSSAQAPAARFDLAGPKIEVRVTRAGKTLPIAAVPNLQPGDKLWLHPDLPPTQSVKYLLIAAFLRGTTNPPPDSWFTRIETWNKGVREEGVFVTVPDEAQQAILFLAPETGGDFSTLRSAVRGRPGVFVRASQDLAEAGFEQSRIERYLAAMRQVAPGDPKALLEHSNLLARTLNLKPNDECFKRPVDMQYTCLTQSGNQTLLDDGHGQTIVTAISNGPGSDLITQASYTQAFGSGVYSAYVGAIVDLVRLTASLHTAQFQYIPAIAFPEDADLKLRLNVAPSFHNPKSVIVIGLPAVQASVAPPLRPADAKAVTCLLKPSVVLPVEGAPLVFSTAFAHDLVLHLEGTDAKTDLALTPDAFQGGLVPAPAPARKVLPEDAAGAGKISAAAAAASSSMAPEVTGTVSGFWGFDAFTGPALKLQTAPGKDWKVSAAEPLIVGRDNHLELASTGTACVDSITLQGLQGKDAETKWKQGDTPRKVEVSMTLRSANPGTLHLAVKQFGDPAPAVIAVESFTEPAQLTGVLLHLGDTFAVLTGSNLGQVKQLALGGLTFLPAADGEFIKAGSASLELDAPKGTAPPKVKPGERLAATVTLQDGRFLTPPVTIAAPRPSVTLLSKNIAGTSHSPIQLSNHDDLPADQQLTFSLHSPQNFPRSGQVEIASADESLHTTLTLAAGTLVLENPHTLLGTLDPLKSFGTSAFGPLRLRALAADGVAGDWIPLATLVRVPVLKELHCPVDPSGKCSLTGTDLFLLEGVAGDAAFTNTVAVPDGFTGTSLEIPRPSASTFYVRLRDDPEAIDPVTLPPLIDKSSGASSGQGR